MILRSGYKEETAAFYGSDKTAQAATTEKRLRAVDADREAAARAEVDRAEAAAYKASRARRQRDDPSAGIDYAAWA
jgi:hypothetical protein